MKAGSGCLLGRRRTTSHTLVPSTLLLAAALTAGACLAERSGAPKKASAWPDQRNALVDDLADRIDDKRVLDALRKVPRHELVPKSVRRHAYQNRPLPIGEDQTISQPEIVALMTQAAALDPGDKVLEVGTGSGYQAAVLGQLVGQVFTIEIVEPLAKRAAADLKRLGYNNITTRVGDGYRGWPDQAPFDAIIVTAAPSHVPKPLLDQLKVGARLVMPVGSNANNQELVVITRTAQGYERQTITPVRFVPMTGEAQKRPRPPGQK